MFQHGRSWLRALGLVAVVLLHMNRRSQPEQEEATLGGPPAAPPIELHWLKMPDDKLDEPANDPASSPTSPPPPTLPPTSPLTPLPSGACVWRRLPRQGVHGRGAVELNRSAATRRHLAGEFECASLCATLEQCRAYSFRARGDRDHRNFGRCFVLARAGRRRGPQADGDIFDSALCDRAANTTANSSQPSMSYQTPPQVYAVVVH